MSTEKIGSTFLFENRENTRAQSGTAFDDQTQLADYWKKNCS